MKTNKTTGQDIRKQFKLILSKKIYDTNTTVYIPFIYLCEDLSLIISNKTFEAGPFWSYSAIFNIQFKVRVLQTPKVVIFSRQNSTFYLYVNMSPTKNNHFNCCFTNQGYLCPINYI